MFCEESYSCNSQPAQYFKKKSTKIILEKQKKNIKTMWENTVAIHNVLKKKNYKVKFLTISILKK
jgi:hypothetical protein